MSAVYIGIDSGGTRTNVEILAPETEWKTRRFEVAATLSGALPISNYAVVLRRILAPIESYWQQHDVPDVPVYVFVGAAGFAAPTRPAFFDTLHGTLPNFFNGNIRAAGACNDAFALISGLEVDGAVIAGTGSNVLVCTTSGEYFQAGGHDWVAADYGAGFWVGLSAIRQAARDFEAGESTVLLDRFCEVYTADGENEDELIAKFRSLAVADGQLKSHIAKFAAGVCQAAELGDLAAQNIVKREAEDLADSLSRTIRRRFAPADLDRNLRIVQCGSLLANDFYRRAFETQVRMRLTSGNGQAGNISWLSTKTGLEAVMSLSQRLLGDISDLVQSPLQFRPAVVKF